jgi:hypothetical protein
LYKAKEQARYSGLYRCTTCGIMIPVNAGETLPACPSRCADSIWTFFNDKWASPPTEIREVSASFPALDLTGDPRTIPVGAQLTDIRLGPEQPGNPNRDPNLAAFHFDGQVYFGSAHELFQKSKVIQS